MVSTTIDFIVKRHGEKKPSPGVISSTPEDRVVPLSEEGRAKELAFGRDVISVRPRYAHIIGITSDYLRTMQTLEANLEGAGYDIKDGRLVTTMARSDIGLGVNNHDRNSHPDMPKYGKGKKVLDAYVRTLFEKFWRPRLRFGNPPCLSAYAAAMMDAVLYSIQRQQTLPFEGSVLVEIVTHCPVIDVAAHCFSGGKSLEQGAFQDGEFFTGRVENDNYAHKYQGLIKWDIKGKEYTMPSADVCRDVMGMPPTDSIDARGALKAMRRWYTALASTKSIAHQ